MKTTLAISILCVTLGLSAASNSNNGSSISSNTKTTILSLAELGKNQKYTPTQARLKSFMQRNAPGNPWHNTFQEHILSFDYDWKTSFMDKASYATQRGDTQKAFLYTFYAATGLCKANEFKEAHEMLNAINYTNAPTEMRTTFIALNAQILNKLNSELTTTTLKQKASTSSEARRSTQKEFMDTFDEALKLCQAGEYYLKIKNGPQSLFYLKKAFDMLNSKDYRCALKEMQESVETLNTLILRKINVESTIAKFEQEAHEYFKAGRDTQGYHNIFRAANELVSTARLWTDHANENHDYIEYARQYYLMTKKILDDLNLKTAPHFVKSKFLKLKKEIDSYIL